jgi:cobalt-zinc-cadmium efflux system outer membrane protein
MPVINEQGGGERVDGSHLRSIVKRAVLLVSRPVALLAGLALIAAPAAAQQRVTLDEAVAAALARGTRARVAEADVAVARADVVVARAFPNPTASLTYSKSPPQYHAIAEQPLELPWLRSARLNAARAGAQAAGYRLAVERAAVRFDVESAYARAAAAGELAALSRRTAREGDELVRFTRVRRDAGDASDLDVELATVTQGGFENQALADSLEQVAALLDLQTQMGMEADRVAIILADSLAGLPLAPPASTAAAATPLRVSAAQADVAAGQARVAQERAGRFAAPSITAGVEWHDPTGGEKGYLPTVGVAVPLPVFDRNRGGIATARANLLRAQAELEAARRGAAAAQAAAERDRAAARVRAARDRSLLEHAERVVQMSVRGYREGAFTLPAVLEAQRTARDALRQYVQDLAALRGAEASAALARTVGGAP